MLIYNHELSYDSTKMYIIIMLFNQLVYYVIYKRVIVINVA